MGRLGNTFCPRRAREERQLQHLLSTEGRGGPRRTATATPFVHEGPRRAAENGNGNTFCPRRATKDHGGPRRAAENGNGNTFCPRRATKGREERQRQHLLSTEGHEGPRRTATATSFCPRRAAKGREERQRQHPFVHEGPRRTTKNGNGNTFCPRRATRGRGELPFDPRSARGEWRGVRRERTLGPSQSGGAGTVAGALRFLVAG